MSRSTFIFYLANSWTVSYSLAILLLHGSDAYSALAIAMSGFFWSFSIVDQSAEVTDPPTQPGCSTPIFYFGREHAASCSSIFNSCTIRLRVYRASDHSSTTSISVRSADILARTKSVLSDGFEMVSLWATGWSLSCDLCLLCGLLFLCFRFSIARIQAVFMCSILLRPWWILWCAVIDGMMNCKQVFAPMFIMIITLSSYAPSMERFLSPVRRNT